METNLVQRCCGLDVHQNTVVACLLLQEPGGKLQKLLRTFGTFTKELCELVAWLVEHRVTHVGMESTGCYWIPVYAVLESEPSLTLIVGNAQHIKNVPGRKTDCNDAQWIATLVRLGMIRPSYVPPPVLRFSPSACRVAPSVAQRRLAARSHQQRVKPTLQKAANRKKIPVPSRVVPATKMQRAVPKGSQRYNLVRRLQRLGYAVEIHKQAA